MLPDVIDSVWSVESEPDCLRHQTGRSVCSVCLLGSHGRVKLHTTSCAVTFAQMVLVCFLNFKECGLLVVEQIKKTCCALARLTISTSPSLFSLDRHVLSVR